MVRVQGPRNRKKLMLLPCHIHILINIHRLRADGLARRRVIVARIAFLVLPLEGLNVLGYLSCNGCDATDLREVDTVVDIVQ